VLWLDRESGREEGGEVSKKNLTRGGIARVENNAGSLDILPSNSYLWIA
jgi:hypothetical protein